MTSGSAGPSPFRRSLFLPEAPAAAILEEPQADSGEQQDPERQAPRRGGRHAGSRLQTDGHQTQDMSLQQCRYLGVRRDPPLLQGGSPLTELDHQQTGGLSARQIDEAGFRPPGPTKPEGSQPQV